MINFYVNRIKQGKMELKDVPALWHDAVRQELINEGWLIE